MEEDTFDLSSYLDVVRRRWWLLAIGPVLAGIVALGITLGMGGYASGGVSPTTYEATTLVLMEGEGGIGNWPELVVVRPVLQGAIDRAALPLSLAELRAKVTATPVERTNLIKISVKDFEQAWAIAIANAVAESLVEHVGSLRQARSGEPTVGASSQLVDSSYFRTGEGLLGGLNGPVIVGPAEVSSESTVSGVSVIIRNLLLGAFLGGMFSVGAVVMLEYLKQPVRSQEQFQRVFGLAPLGEIPKWRNKGKGLRQLVVSGGYGEVSGEALRRAAANLEFAALTGEVQTIAIASADSGDGRSTLLANLGVALAENWREMVLVDTDLRCPSLHRFFDLDNDVGLTTLLANPGIPIARVLKQTPHKGLKIITSGPVPPNPLELLRCPRMTWLLEQLKETADIVLLDTPPALALADGTALASQVDGVVLMADAGNNRKAVLKATLDSLQRPGPRVLGFIWNRSDPRPFFSRSRLRGYYQRLTPDGDPRYSAYMSNGSNGGVVELQKTARLSFTSGSEGWGTVSSPADSVN